MRCIYLLSLTVLAICPTTLVGQQQICDPELKPTGLYPYALRGDRCEGLYEVELSYNDELPVAGFTVPGREIEYRDPRRIHVRWHGQSGDVRLRAESLRWRTYYRMDTTRPASGRLFTWPTVILGALEFSRSEIAVLAWLEEGLPPSRRVHLPVVLDTATALRPTTAYELVIVPTTEFTRVRMTLYRVLPSGELQLVGPLNVEVGEPPFDRDIEIRITVPLTGTLAPGDYEIQLSGQRETGGWVPKVFRFRHAASPL